MRLLQLYMPDSQFLIGATAEAENLCGNAIFHLLLCDIPNICTILMKILRKSKVSEMLSLTGSRFMNPLSASLAWLRIFWVS